MIIVKPFSAIRPADEYGDKVAALPYDVMNSDEAREMVKDNPFSFLHIDKAEIDLPTSVDHYSDEVYAKAKSNLEKMLSDKVMIQDEKPSFYIYRLTRLGKVQTGLVTCTSVDQYLENTIKKHEFTRADKEQDRIRHVDTLNAQTGPIFLAYKQNAEILSKLNSLANDNAPIYDFTSDDGVGHTVWKVDDSANIDFFVNAFAKVDNLYIADGHHRNASAAKVALKRREEKGADYDKNAEFNYYLSVLFSSEELLILDYNRVVKDLNGLSKTDLISKLEEKFQVQKISKDNRDPKTQHSFTMYIEKEWYELVAKSDILKSDPVDGLDVAILQHEVLTPMLGIEDPRVDQRIDFVGGIRGLDELEKRVNSGEMAVAFAMYPTSMNELMAVADADLVMPPKSTWFEPKLRSGLFIHDLEN